MNSKVVSYKKTKGKIVLNESGSALIVVVSLIALASVLAASAIAQAHKTSLLSSVFLRKSFVGYTEEGASARIAWLIANDRRKFPQRVLGTSMAEINELEPRYLADAVPRTIDYYGFELIYKISDMASGIDISGPTAASNLKLFEGGYDGTKLEDYRALINKFEDYVDNNDLIRLNSIEADGYNALNLFPLPRNSQLEFKEEILWIPGASDFFKPDENGRLSLLRVVPPKGMPRPSISNNFFSTNNQIIKSTLGLTDAETEQVVGAKKKWLEDGTDLSATLETGLLTRLRTKFSFNESGYYTIQINGNPQDTRIGKKLIVSLRISNSFTNPGLRYYEFFSY